MHLTFIVAMTISRTYVATYIGGNSFLRFNGGLTGHRGVSDTLSIPGIMQCRKGRHESIKGEYKEFQREFQGSIK